MYCKIFTNSGENLKSKEKKDKQTVSNQFKFLIGRKERHEGEKIYIMCMSQYFAQQRQMSGENDGTSTLTRAQNTNVKGSDSL
jgi:hypothetical protein